MYGEVKREKKEHGHLMKLLKKHFHKDEGDWKEEEEEEKEEEKAGYHHKSHHSIDDREANDRDEKDDDDDRDEDEQVKPMTLYQGKKQREDAINKGYSKKEKPHSDVAGADGHSTDEDKMYGENCESDDDGYDSTSPDNEQEYERDKKEEEDEDSQPMLPKAQRKRMAVAVIAKKMSKPKRK